MAVQSQDFTSWRKYISPFFIVMKKKNGLKSIQATEEGKTVCSLNSMEKQKGARRKRRIKTGSSTNRSVYITLENTGHTTKTIDVYEYFN